MIYLYLGKHEFFSAFHCLKQRDLLPAERLSCLYIQWCAHMDVICKECLWKKCVFAPKFIAYRGEIKGSETFRLILSEKIDPPRKQYTSFPLLTLKCCCLQEKLEKHIKFVTFIYLHDRPNSRHFF